MKVISKFITLFKSTISLIIFLFFLGLAISAGIRGFAYFSKLNNQVDQDLDLWATTKTSASDFLENEKKWSSDKNSCSKLEDQENKLYCNNIRNQCAEFITSSNYLEDEVPFRKCISEIRKKMGMSKIMDIFYNPIIIIKKNEENENGEINWALLYDEPFMNFESIKKNWETKSPNQKLKIVRNIYATGTIYEQFPDWMKSDPVVNKIKEELNQ